jgi:hypothetical protein
VLRARVLPGLSPSKALLEESGDTQKVLAEMDSLFKAAFFHQEDLGDTRVESFARSLSDRKTDVEDDDQE